MILEAADLVFAEHVEVGGFVRFEAVAPTLLVAACLLTSEKRATQRVNSTTMKSSVADRRSGFLPAGERGAQR